MINYDKLPEHMREGARLYIEEGIDPGSFMVAALANQLVEAFARADETNAAYMRDWASWLYMDCPRVARGSIEKVEAWIHSGGIKGQSK